MIYVGRMENSNNLSESATQSRHQMMKDDERVHEEAQINTWL